ncbi:glycosyltransferase family 25 protein [Shewanella sp. 3_MG-2023]|uniref:glycosyltransferase family 25 protein n=1 Tax=Shewanella sp. 3_MG-2023 TaxID=3062635 RepID=UPI0026E31B9A|nr:glycosyltransferase family 25 protein [Shewanella sp. 3_MG-2023]MDO6775165.1 glycosyltransferase family 25 protein [Shewanella sp. 3_MG-2023]
MKFKVFVINLDKSTERMAFMQQQLEQLNIEFERVPAVYGKDLTSEIVSNVYDRKLNLLKYNKELSLGEIGCYLSHIKCWEYIVSQELDFAVILEDDAVISNELIFFMDKLKDFIGWDYIKICKSHKHKKVYDNFDLSLGCALHKAYKFPASNRGQIVSICGARKLLETAFPISRPVDIDIQYWFEKNLHCFVSTPTLITGKYFESDIDMQGGRNIKRVPFYIRLWQKISFELKLIENRHCLPDFPKFKGRE